MTNRISMTSIVLLAAGSTAGQCLSLLEPAGSIPVAPLANGVAVADFNGDGLNDIAQASDQAGHVGIALADGMGGFGPLDTISIPGVPALIEPGDFDEDGNIDLVVSSRDSADLNLLFGNGDGTFALTTVMLPQGDMRADTGDINNDGHLDIVVGHYSPSGAGANMTPLLGRGDGTFDIMPQIATETFLSYTSVGDLNGDGNDDVVIGTQHNFTVQFFLSDGAGGFTRTLSEVLGGGIRFPRIGDVTGDGHADVLFTENPGSAVWLYEGDGAGGVVQRTAIPVNPPFALDTGDFDADGHTDFWVTRNDEAVDVFFGAGDGSFVLGESQPLSGGLNEGTTGDINNDGRPDIVISNRIVNRLDLFANICEPVEITAQPVVCQLVDLPAAPVELRVATSEPNPVYQWRFDGQPLIDMPGVFGSETASLVVTPDAFREGIYDCVVSNATAQAVSRPSLLAVRYQPADQNGDGVVSPTDFGAWLANFNAAQ